MRPPIFPRKAANLLALLTLVNSTIPTAFVGNFADIFP